MKTRWATLIILVIDENRKRREEIVADYCVLLDGNSIMGEREILEAGSLEEAENLAEQRKPDFIVFDSGRDESFKERVKMLAKRA